MLSSRTSVSAIAASAGFSHGAAVGEDGSLFVWGETWGYKSHGQLGTGDTAERLAPNHGQLGLGDEEDRATRSRYSIRRFSPTLVARVVFDGEAVLMVVCGGLHTAALTKGGGVYTFRLGDVGSWA